jgi:signal transduction histidine kinase
MKKPISLKLTISLTTLLLGIVIVFAYSAISRHFFFLGMDNIVSANMEQAAKNYLVLVSEEKQSVLQHFDGYDISHDWFQQPDTIKNRFDEPDDINQLEKFIVGPLFSRPDIIYFVIKLEVEHTPLFISKTSHAANSSRLIGENIKESRHLLIIISTLVTISLALSIWLINRRISQPISQLGKWTHSLNSKSLSTPPPDFYYPELNEMANLIRNSLSSVQESIEREERFLGFASHELRTPISVIRNNVELIGKLKQSAQGLQQDKLERIIERIDRASLTMKNLSETLLWLSRDKEEELSVSTLSLDMVIQDLVKESSYLLKGKDIELTVRLDPNTKIYQPEHPVRIVIGNLIRNAFQHTQAGQVSIVQEGSQITIINATSAVPKDEKIQDLGFGLGLQLTKQLTEKLGWAYQTEELETTYTAVLKL